MINLVIPILSIHYISSHFTNYQIISGTPHNGVPAVATKNGVIAFSTNYLVRS